jgi:hypothetical protein
LVQTTTVPVSATAKLAPGHAGIRLEEIRPRVLALALGEIVDIGILRIGADRFRKHPGHVASQLVHGWHYDVTRRLVVELLDALAQIGLHDLDPAAFEKGPHLAFVGQHRLGLDQRLRATRAHDVEHDLVVLGSVLRPVNVRTVRDRVALELLEVVGEMAQRMLLDRRGQDAQLLPFGEVLALAIALLAQIPEPLVVKIEVVLRLDELRRGFGVVDAFHDFIPAHH